MQRYEGWEEFYKKPIEDKLESFKKDGKIFDAIYAQQFDSEYLEELFSLADKVRLISKTKNGMDYLSTVLSDKRAMLFFVQPSTRTFLSFLNACQILGMNISEIRDASTSSEVKGESAEDMIRTFSSYVDLVIVRHFDEGFAELAAWVLNEHSGRSVPVINGGSGKDQHPTQALLDLYTLHRSFALGGGIKSKKIAMVGDLSRGRTVRSLCRLLSLYEGIELFFVSPEKFAMKQDILDFLGDNNIKFTQVNSLDDVISDVDAIYSTRIQDEHDKDGESANIDYSKYQITSDNVEKMKKDAVILHPFPRREEISSDVDKNSRAAYWKQARNGMWVRIALIIKIFGREGYINNIVRKK